MLRTRKEKKIIVRATTAGYLKNTAVSRNKKLKCSNFPNVNAFYQYGLLSHIGTSYWNETHMMHMQYF